MSLPNDDELHDNIERAVICADDGSVESIEYAYIYSNTIPISLERQHASNIKIIGCTDSVVPTTSTLKHGKESISSGRHSSSNMMAVR